MNTSNGTNTPENAEYKKVIFFTINSIIAFSILVVNLAVLILIIYSPRLHHKLTNKILLRLVVSDLIASVLMFLHIIAEAVPQLAKRSSPPAYCYRIILDIATLWQQLITIGNLCVIITERYIATAYPYTVHQYITEKKVSIILNMIWVTAVLYSCTQLFWVHKVLDGKWTKQEELSIKHADSIFSSISFILFVILPILILSVIFVKMFQLLELPQTSNIRRKTEEKRVIILLCIMYGTFVLLSLPYFLVRLAVDIDFLQFEIHIDAQNIAYTLKYLSSLANPFVYTLNKPDFKMELRRLKLQKLNKEDKLSLDPVRKRANNHNHHHYNSNNHHNNNSNNNGISMHLINH